MGGGDSRIIVSGEMWLVSHLLKPQEACWASRPCPLPSGAPSVHMGPRGLVGGKKRGGEQGRTLQDQGFRGNAPNISPDNSAPGEPAGVPGLVLHPLRPQALLGLTSCTEPKPPLPPPHHGPFPAAWALSLGPGPHLNHVPA